MTLECLHCFNEYDPTTSTANLRHMYCSKEHEDAEDEKLKEGNEIVREAESLNPLFEQEKKQQDLKHMPLSGIINFVKKAE